MSMPQSLGKKDAPGRPLSKGDTERELDYRAEQCHIFFLCSAVLYTRNSPGSELHKAVIQLVLHPSWFHLRMFHSVTKDLILAL